MKFNPLPIILAAVGSYLLIKLRFFFILHPIKTTARGMRAIRDKRARRSFFLAMAGTLGVGNVFGVALGIMIGGAGSLFWLLVSMIFAMALKYSEVVITGDNLYHERDTHGGIYYVIKASFSRGGRFLSTMYSLVVIGLSLTLGAALQSDAVAQSAEEIVDLPLHVVALCFVLLTLFAIVGGTRKIEKITAVIIPLTTIIYIFITMLVVLVNADLLVGVLSNVITSAFSFDSAAGGIIGFLTSAQLREGFARGVLSNEAGAGTSSIAHARSGVLSPASAGILGIFEVWFDTGLVCMLTGLSILLSVPDVSLFNSGMELISYAIGSIFGVFGKTVLSVCVFSFALATVICWYYYGSEAWGTVLSKKSRVIFLPIFLYFVYIGCFADTMLLVSLTDVFMLLATLISVIALIKNSDRIKFLSESGGVIPSKIGLVRRLGIKSVKGSVSMKEERRR